MPQKYDASKAEAKWRKKWLEEKLYETDLNDASRPKYYNLVMFPYPSGDKLHIGHWYSYAPADSWGRFMRMHGYNVFEPIGFDSFGLPAENYAIKTGVHPAESTTKNIAYMRGQLRAMGTMYDWDKEVVTCEPFYYRWTQWIFLKLYEKGLAYRKKAPVNFCPSCKTVLANEQAQDGTCERCGSEVTQKELVQWFFKITDYAERLLNHDKLDWPEKTKIMQTNWIGKSEGVNFHCKIKDFDYEFDVYDSVPQTHMAQTFSVISAEHPLLPKLIKGKKEEKEVLKCIERIRKKKMSNRFDVDKDIDGAFTGCYIEDPYGVGDLPLWVSSFAIMGYGSGIVNCSAHDERDFAFAKKYKIPLRPVMFPKDPKEAKKVRNLEYCYHHAEDGILEAPEKFRGRLWGEAREDIIKYLEKAGIGKTSVNYKLRDWLLSRQRYWGAPIPIIYCDKCGEVPVPEKDLPVLLATDVDFKPKGGMSPLATSEKFVNTKCPACGGKAKRETDTMDTFVCSSWYFLRYPSAHEKDKPFDRKLTGSWLPVDMYVGGPEHACMHLIYARFINMALKDLGYIDFEEPFKKLVHQGMITKNGAKMSKSKGNVVSPDEFVSKYGSDVFRMYLMFMGPFEDGGDWDDHGITGIARFVERLYELFSSKSEPKDPVALTKFLHKTIKRVTKDIKQFHFNTAIAALMEFLNFASKDGISGEAKRELCKILAPLAPHFAEEIWREVLGNRTSIFNEKWPKFDPALCIEDICEMVIQINGKIRGKMQVPVDISKEDAIKKAKEIELVRKYLSEGKILKEIFVPGKLVSFVVTAKS